MIIIIFAHPNYAIHDALGGVNADTSMLKTNDRQKYKNLATQQSRKAAKNVI